MSKNNALAVRMKEYYENRHRIYLPRRIPVIIRIDGKAFHNFTAGFDKPYDEVFSRAMQNTAKRLCGNIQGCVLAYVQSDEISLLLIDYQNIKSDAWFDYNLQKITTVAASMATFFFYEEFRETYTAWKYSDRYNSKLDTVYNKAMNKYSLFDARAFSMPKEEVTNYFLWRQQDATRNSIESLGQKYFSNRELNGKTTSEVQDMLMLQKGVNWNNIETKYKRGSCVQRVCVVITTENGTTSRNKWQIDDEIPIFSQDRDYIERKLYSVGLEFPQDS